MVDISSDYSDIVDVGSRRDYLEVDHGFSSSADDDAIAAIFIVHCDDLL